MNGQSNKQHTEQTTMQAITALLRELLTAFVDLARTGLRRMARLPMPQLLTLAIGLALLLTILPLALTLFMVFLLIKVLILCSVLVIRKARRRGSRLEFPRPAEPDKEDGAP
ncbi:hypothetical protein LPB67_10370 [Undibacterium sp. Jales W-56]|uniref:hypothetical protein n=1 Tax=Undibacterium sp. Jales W-56 TaxID=2897325 RepID=UPI0021CEA048|nr:hypothetical protein [Undibacterium sp. Jales W-56]MCU6434173.1 hypothetical protein [Undibacterium sp. Jales W-56]